ncbi:MAG: Rrf2 family transcriptional regulator [Candidatus Zixiibacteriota bacterium]|nr:MAG: Rrf2 family transcriptional regulator [candidate division Zixibacteria bacterium]
MKVTALEEYGVRCMLLFAKNGSNMPLTLAEISTREGLSVPYAGKLLMILKQAGLVKAVRGRRGGYTLARAPQEIRLSAIFNALGEPFFSPHHCARYSGLNEVCIHGESCNVRRMWNTFDSFIGSVFNIVTLDDLANGDYDFGKVLRDSIKIEAAGEFKPIITSDLTSPG